MRNGVLGCLAALLAGAGLAAAQPPAKPAVPSPFRYASWARPEAEAPPAAAPPAPAVLSPVPTAGCLTEGVADGCGTPLCCEPGCVPCGPPGRVWARAEYLLWWIKDTSLPPLITTGTAASQGFLNAPGTVILFGGSDINYSTFSGGRFTLGGWLDRCNTIGLEGSFFFLGERSRNYTATSDQFPILSRPFFNQNAGTQFIESASFPGISSGALSASTSTQLWGYEVNPICNLCCGCWYRLDGLFGFRYLDLREDVRVGEVVREADDLSQFPPIAQFAGNRFLVRDRFETRNQFYGGQLGTRAEAWRGRFFANVTGKVGLGVTHQTVNVTGNQTRVTPQGQTFVSPGGLLALPSNLGQHTRDVFGVVPEAGVNVGYQLTRHLRASVGYTFLYWNNVLRPGDQIDPVIDVTQVPNFPVNATPVGRARPRVPFNDTDFWAQGLNFGLEVRW